jgi:hypothetical protein
MSRTIICVILAIFVILLLYNVYSNNNSNIENFQCLDMRGKVDCAREGGKCVIGPDGKVTYGDKSNISKTKTIDFGKGSAGQVINCNNRTFGDPAPGIQKFCVTSEYQPVDMNGLVQCTNEGGKCIPGDDGIIIYGDRNNRNRTTSKRFNIQGGPIDCNNRTFGDPAPGVRKSCITKKYQPIDMTNRAVCANEGGKCVVGPDGVVIYGDRNHRGRTTSRGFKAGSVINCNNGTFGDPARGTSKQCVTTTPRPVDMANRVICANEGGKCAVGPDGSVIYGDKNNSNRTTVGNFQPGSIINCNNRTFGDPARGIHKFCITSAPKPTTQTAQAQVVTGKNWKGYNISTNGRCGPSYGNTACPGKQCCSIFGWCGGEAGKNDAWCRTYKGFSGIFDGINPSDALAPLPINVPKLDATFGPYYNFNFEAYYNADQNGNDIGATTTEVGDFSQDKYVNLILAAFKACAENSNCVGVTTAYNKNTKGYTYYLKSRIANNTLTGIVNNPNYTVHPKVDTFIRKPYQEYRTNIGNPQTRVCSDVRYNNNLTTICENNVPTPNSSGTVCKLPSNLIHDATRCLNVSNIFAEGFKNVEGFTNGNDEKISLIIRVYDKINKSRTISQKYMNNVNNFKNLGVKIWNNSIDVFYSDPIYAESGAGYSKITAFNSIMDKNSFGNILTRLFDYCQDKENINRNYCTRKPTFYDDLNELYKISVVLNNAMI